MPLPGRRGQRPFLPDGRDTVDARAAAAADYWPVTVRYVPRATATDRVAERRWWAPTDRAATLTTTGSVAPKRAPYLTLVETVRAALQMPPTLRDCELWLQMRWRTAPTDPLLAQLPSRWRRQLHNRARDRRAFANRTLSGRSIRGLVATITTPATTGRAVPARFGVAPFSAHDHHAARAADIL